MSVSISICVLILVLTIIILLFGIYQKNTNEVCKSKKRLDGKTALITGGTAGMGLEIAIDFAQRGARVIVASPFEDEGSHALETIVNDSENQNVVFQLLDLGSIESVRNLATDLLKTEDRLDILVNNAGIGGPNKTTSDELNFVVQVNYYGAFLLTVLLLPLLKKTGRPGEPSRVVNVSSASYVIGRVDIKNLDAHTFFLQSYMNSKLYIIMFTKELTKRLKDSNVVVNNADPGVVGTKIYESIMKGVGFFCLCLFWVLGKNPWLGAQTAIHVAVDKKAGEVSGEYFKNCKLAKVRNSAAFNEKLATQLWEESIRLVKLTNEELEHCFNSQ